MTEIRQERQAKGRRKEREKERETEKHEDIYPKKDTKYKGSTG
jgi:hypothetical protein